MNRVILVAMAVLAVASVAQAKNYVYGDNRSTLESAGYQLFVSDKIVDTVDRIDKTSDKGAGYCSSVDENTSKSLGDISTIRTDKRFQFADNTKLRTIRFFPRPLRRAKARRYPLLTADSSRRY